MTDAISDATRPKRYWHGAFTGDVITLKEESVYRQLIQPGVHLNCINGGGAFIYIEGFNEAFNYLDFDIIEKVYTGSRYY
jgi:hypothetical protein